MKNIIIDEKYWSVHVVLILLLYGHLVIGSNGAEVNNETASSDMASWLVIVAYVSFALGGLLIVIGFVRITWFACISRKKKTPSNIYSNASLFSSQNNDPWLKENPTVNNRIELYGEEGSLTESQLHDSPRSGDTENNVEHVYHSLPKHGIVHGREVRIDGDTLHRNAKYVEPNTNVVLAKKHRPPSSLPITELLEQATMTRSRENINNDTTQEDAVSPRSISTSEAFYALDSATAGEDVVTTPRSDVSVEIPGTIYNKQVSHSASQVSSTPTAQSMVSTRYLVEDEPLPGHQEVEYNYEKTSTYM